MPLAASAPATDATPPETFIDSGPAEGGTIATGSVVFTFHATDVDDGGVPQGGTTCSYKLEPVETNFGSPVACPTTPLAKVYSNLENGDYTFIVRAHDASSNVDPTPSTRNFTVDRGPDPLLNEQWHLKPRALELAGSNVSSVWTSLMGAGVVLGIVDDGLQHTHPDLQANYSSALSWDFNFNDPDPAPFSTAAHGTAVAGVTGARIGNAIGVSGAAPWATLAGLRVLGAPASDLTEANAFAHQTDAIQILNNSWGPADDGATLEGPGPLAQAAIETAAVSGRAGKGRIFVWAAGNGRNGTLESDNCNFDGYASNRFAVSVGSVNDLAVQAEYSESCAALLVSAPSGDTDPARRDITTTDLAGANGYSAGDYTSTFGGTSAAAPLVSGVVALMLEQNPSLGWRDVKFILRETSSRSAIADPAADWSSGPRPHSHRYGFGLVDAEAAVTRAATWINVPPERTVASALDVVGAGIPDNSAFGISRSVMLGSEHSGFLVEHVEVEFTATHNRRGDIEVTLTSPSGLVSTLATVRTADTQPDFSGWRFRSVRHWGEAAAGNWTLTVKDRRSGTTGTFGSWRLRLYGTNRGYLSGVVTGSGSPLGNVTIQIRNSIGSVVATVVSDANGRYAVDGLAAGSYRVQAVAPGGYLNQAYDGINCLAACGPTVGELVAVTDGAESSGIDFALVPRAAIADVAPASGSELGGTLVAISGTNFTTPSSVTFGGSQGANVTLLNASTIHVVTPAHALGTVDVTVTFADGQVATLAGAFTYAAPPPLAVTSVVFEPPGPVQQGTSVTVTAASIGGNSPQYQFWRYDVGANGWSMVRDYGASPTYTWPSASVITGTFAFVVRARSAGSLLPFDHSYQTDYFVVTAGTPARITSVKITPAPVIQHGSVVTLTATAAGGTGTLEYEFRRANVAGGDWTVVKPYTTPGSSYSWNPGIADLGGYSFEVRVRSQGSSAPMENAYGSILVVVAANPPAVLTGVSVAPASPAAAGTIVTWTAHASGGVAPLQYQFWRHHEESRTWSLVQDYSASATYTWPTTSTDAGTYIVHVRTRSSGSTAAYESVYQTGRFHLSEGASPAVIASIIPRPSSPIVPGTLVTLTARASGGSAPLEYQFWRLDAGQGVWTLLRDFAITDTATWIATAGAHLFQVRVRSTGSVAIDHARSTSAWMVVSSSPTARLTGLTGPALPVAAPSIATWTAQANNGSEPLQYQFHRYHEQTNLWALVQDYGVSNSYSWNTTAADAGSYLLQVRARRAGSSLPFESIQQSGWYFVSNGTPALLTSLTASTGRSTAPGNPVTWNAAATGTPLPEYEFRRLDASTGEWSIVRNAGLGSAYTWIPDPEEIGTYKFQVRVRKTGFPTFDHMLESAWFVVSSGAVATLTGINGPVSPANTGTTVAWTAQATGGVAPLQYQFWRHHLESNTWSLEQDYSTNNVFSWTTTANDMGTYVFQVRIRSIGSSVPFEHVLEAAPVVLQLPPPETSIDSGPPASTLATTATFTFSASEAGATFECSLDATTFASCTSPVTLTSLAVGAHDFRVRAIGTTGSVDSTPASRVWTILPPDTTAPDTTINSGPPASTTATAATFTFSANETGATFACSLDGAAFTACASPASYVALLVGNHTFTVRATDLSGNTDATPAGYSWTILPPDTTAPNTTLDSAPPPSTISTSASFTFSSNEGGSTFECSLDAAPFALCTSPWTYSGLADGGHTFAVRAIDAAGNVDLTPANHAWTITAPNCGAPTTLLASGDAWIDQSSPTSNMGSDSVLKVQSKSSNGNMRALVRFTLPTLPQGCIVQAATLTLFAASATTGRTLNALRISGTWAESTVTWSNQPATTGAAASTASGTGDRQWNVTAQLQAMYDSSLLHGFLIRDASESAAGFEQQLASRESAQTPTLSITFAASSTRSMPDPAARRGADPPQRGRKQRASF
jgi:subtilisin-like proprotein convertase family protein